jgi:hypothetical protein
MKPELCHAIPGDGRNLQLQTYAVCISADCQGDFVLSKQQWRVVSGVRAFSAKEAHDEFRQAKPELKFRRMMVTDYPPALDVLSSRQLLS